MANILIVDSYSALNSLYSDVLEEYGHCVFPVESGREAVLLALYKTIDIAIVDDNLPDLSADDVLSRLKQLKPHVRGILDTFSIFGAAPDAERWDGLVTKSFDYTPLEAEVDKLAGISSPPSIYNSVARIQDRNHFPATALGSEEDASSSEKTILESQRNDMKLKIS